MASKLTQEQFIEECTRLEEELKRVQLELNDTLALNDEFVKSLEEKDADLLRKDARLIALREKNKAEIYQLELERDASMDNWKHQVVVRQKILQDCKMNRAKFDVLVNENEKLKLAIRDLLDKTTSESTVHAAALHAANKNMMVLRHQMETKLRRELNVMNMSYQKDAFAALSDAQKKAMFENAKLKDEVALQGVGIVNLGARLAKQKHALEFCEEEMKLLHKKAKHLSDMLASKTQVKNTLSKDRERITAEHRKLTSEKNALERQLNHIPVLDDLEADLLRGQKRLPLEEARHVMWKDRIRAFESLKVEIKPVYDNEKLGHFDAETFRINFNRQLNIMNDSRINTASSSSGGGVGLGDFHPSLSRSATTPFDGEGRTSRSGAGSPVPGRKASRSGVESPAPGPPPGSAGSPGDDLSGGGSPSNRGLVTAQTQRVTEIQQLLRLDTGLSRALLPVKGMENAMFTTQTVEKPPHLVSGSSTMDESTTNKSEQGMDQNMVGWLAMQIVSVWLDTAAVADVSAVKRRAELVSSMSSRPSTSKSGVQPGGSVLDTREQSMLSDLHLVSQEELRLRDMRPATSSSRGSPSPSPPPYSGTRGNSTRSVVMFDSGHLVSGGGGGGGGEGLSLDVEERPMTEEEVETGWDDVFAPTDMMADDAGAAAGEGTGSLLSPMSWLKPVPDLMRYPPSDYHLTSKGGTQKSTNVLKGDLFAEKLNSSFSGPPVITGGGKVERELAATKARQIEELNKAHQLRQQQLQADGVSVSSTSSASDHSKLPPIVDPLSGHRKSMENLKVSQNLKPKGVPYTTAKSIELQRSRSSQLMQQYEMKKDQMIKSQSAAQIQRKGMW